MIVCIAEKPSVARDIARVIGATQQKNGYIEGNGYQVTWTFGHLCTLKEPHDYNQNWKRWTLSSLPIIPTRFGIKLIDNQRIKKQFDIIQKLMQQADTIINCGDAGQEGELIQRWVIQKAKATCQVKRLWISSMTDEAIRQGFNNLEQQNKRDPLYMAGLARAIGDWILGINATRLYTLKYAQQQQVLSIGRVQTPTLALIVNRQKEIDNFTPQPYWILSTIYRDTLFTALQPDEDNQTASQPSDQATNPKNDQTTKQQTPKGYLSEEQGQQAFELIQGKPLTITSIKKKTATEHPPYLYDLTSLQVDANKKYNYSAETTLNTIQSLYEKKITTYPRVDTQYLTDDIYPKCPAIMNALYQYTVEAQKPYAQLVKAIAGKPLKKSKKTFDNSKVTDHHAIIPTGTVPRGLTQTEQNIFDLIARRFIAAFHPECKYATTTVQAKIDSINFQTTGKQILQPGWHIVYDNTPADQTSNTPADQTTNQTAILPTFTKGETGPHTPTLTQKQTTPPQQYTEATLLRAMETAGKFVEDQTLRNALKQNGIGRPSSRAGIIETLFKRNYIKRKGKKLIPTTTGTQLINTIQEPLLKSCELTGIWEKKLRDIEHQQYNPQQFVEELKLQIQDIVNTVLADNTPRNITTTNPSNR